MIIELYDPSELLEYERNPKIHSDEQIEYLKESINRFGFVQPIVVDDNNVIIAGHARRRAAIELKLSPVPVVRVCNLTPEECLALNIIDNDIHRQAVDDLELAAAAIGSLEDVAAAEALGIEIPLDYEVKTIRDLVFRIPLSDLEEIESQLGALGSGDISLGFIEALNRYQDA